MLPSLTSNEGLTDFFGGGLTGGEVLEGEAPEGAFLALLNSLGASAPSGESLGAGELELAQPAESSLEDTQEGLEVAQLLAHPELPGRLPEPVSLEHDLEGGASPTTPVASLDLDLADQGVEASLPRLQEQRSALEEGGGGRAWEAPQVPSEAGGLQEAGQAIRAQAGVEAAELAPEEVAPPQGESLPSAPSSAAAVEETLPGAQPSRAAELTAARGQRSEKSSGDESVSEGSGEGARTNASDASADPAPVADLDSPADSGQLASPEGEGGPHEQSSEPPLRVSEGRDQGGPAPTRGAANFAPELVDATPDLAGTSPLEVDALEEVSAAEAPSEGAPLGEHDLISQLEISIEPGREEARIQLHPEELGRVDVRVRRREGRIVATLTVERPETSAEIEAQLPELRDALEAKGVELDEVEVQTGAFDLDAEQGRERGREDSAPEQTLPEEAAPRRPRRLSQSARSGRPDPSRAAGATLDTLA